MRRRLLAVLSLFVLVSGTIAPAAVLAATASSVEDCCCPKGLCPIVDGQHMCKLGAKKESAAPAGPSVARCASSDAGLLPPLPLSLEATRHVVAPSLVSALVQSPSQPVRAGFTRLDVPPPRFA